MRVLCLVWTISCLIFTGCSTTNTVDSNEKNEAVQEINCLQTADILEITDESLLEKINRDANQFFNFCVAIPIKVINALTVESCAVIAEWGYSYPGYFQFQYCPDASKVYVNKSYRVIAKVEGKCTIPLGAPGDTTQEFVLPMFNIVKVYPGL